MIKVKLFNKDNVTNKLSIKGHANHEENGKDIVCAGVSSIITTTINAILRLNSKAITYENNKEILTIEVLIKDTYTVTLIENMISLLSELKDNYPKNIEIKEENL